MFATHTGLAAHHGAMRLFIGIPLSPTVAAELAALRRRLERPGENLRWSAPESWHITLQFLGASSEPQYDCVLAGLGAIHATPVPVHLEAPGFFQRAGVFHVGVRTTPELLALQRAVLAATAGCGFEPEDRPYSPHITLARNRGREDGIRGLKPRLGPAPELPGFTATELLLYESHLGPQGSRYEVRAHFPLRPAHSPPKS
jgi:RNA 2',3'-cyclic 3'-phosphodiesterase